MLYSIQVLEPVVDGLKTEYIYWVELGEKYTKHSEAMQKRFVRHLVEQHYGHPVKNPTQKLYLHDSVFTMTEHINDRWYVVITTTKISGAENGRYGRLGVVHNRRGKTVPKG